METLATTAYKKIQSDPILWKEWNDCKTERDRSAMLIEAVWKMAYDAGYDAGYASAYDAGYDDAYAAGREAGYGEGLKEGLENPYDYGI